MSVFNINNRAKVVLTKKGAEVINKVFDSKRYNEDSVITTELWDLMNIFGVHLYNGGDTLFKNNNLEIIDEFQSYDKLDTEEIEESKHIPLHGQGYGIDENLKNHPVYDKDGNLEECWASRSCAVMTVVICKDISSEWKEKYLSPYFVLACKRGKGTPDYQGMWNVPCGYLDYNETAKEAAIREVFEETGFKIEPEQISDEGYSTSPMENKQNVVFFFSSMIEGVLDNCRNKLSLNNMEENEVDTAKWVNLDEIKTLRWAFDHDKRLIEIINKNIQN